MEEDRMQMHMQIRYNALQRNAIEYKAIPYTKVQDDETNTIHCSNIGPNAKQYKTSRCTTYKTQLPILYNTIQYYTIQCKTIKCNTMQCNAVDNNTIRSNISTSTIHKKTIRTQRKHDAVQDNAI